MEFHCLGLRLILASHQPVSLASSAAERTGVSSSSVEINFLSGLTEFYDASFETSYLKELLLVYRAIFSIELVLLLEITGQDPS